MIDGDQVHFQTLIFSDPSDIFLVYKGEYTPFNSDGSQELRQIAIKELKLPADSHAIISGTVQEIALQMKLEDCPYVCKCYGYFIRENKIFIVSELLGLDLDKDCRLRNGRKYTESDLLQWMDQVLQALTYAKDRVSYTQRVAHRDIRPHNILLAGGGDIKIIDFGSGVISDGKVEKVAGMPLYMSPEQAPILREFQRSGKIPNCKVNAYQSDVYSLGVTFVHLALMEAPVKLLVDDREGAVSGYLEQVRTGYPVLHGALYYMLQTEVAKRPEFSQILSYLRNPGDPKVCFERVQIADDLSSVYQAYSAFWTCVSGWDQQFATVHELGWLPYFETAVWRNCDYCRKPFQIADLLDVNQNYLACSVCYPQYTVTKAVVHRARGWSPAAASSVQKVIPEEQMEPSRSLVRLGTIIEVGRSGDVEFWRGVEQGEHEW